MRWFRTLTSLMALGLIMGCGKPAPTPGTTADEPVAEVEKGTSEEAVTPKQAEELDADLAAIAAIEAVFKLPADDGKPLDVETAKAFLDDPKNSEVFVPAVPKGLAPMDAFIPADNPLTVAKVELGRLLYFDKRLSRDNTVSCASCHDPSTGWAQNTPVAAGIGGQLGGRNSPSVMNRAYGKTQFWDGRAAHLEAQSLGPIENPIEMGFTLDEAIERLKASEVYKMFFDKVFEGQITKDNMAKAMASFERLVVTGGAPYDYYAAAKRALAMSSEDIEDLDPETKEVVLAQLEDVKKHPMSESAQRGMELYFGKAQCSLCHVGDNLTDELFYNIGVGMDKESFDAGRVVVSKNEKETGAFKTPSLRNIALTAPYMHDGSHKTLVEVVEYYNKGGMANPHLHERVKKLNLTEQEVADVAKFMEEGLTGPMPKITAPRLPE